MTSLRHNQVSTGSTTGATGSTDDDAYLDAARETVLAVGWQRTTLTEVARRAGVSRMTIYRRWPDMPALLGDLMVREWGPLLALGDQASDEALGAASLAHAVVAGVRALRRDPLFRKMVEVDPELVLPYLVERPGRLQERALALLTGAVARGQEAGRIRDGDPAALASTLLLALHGPLLAAPVVTAPRATRHRTTLTRLDTELALLLERYLAP